MISPALSQNIRVSSDIRPGFSKCQLLLCLAHICCQARASEAPKLPVQAVEETPIKAVEQDLLTIADIILQNFGLVSQDQLLVRISMVTTTSLGCVDHCACVRAWECVFLFCIIYVGVVSLAC